MPKDGSFTAQIRIYVSFRDSLWMRLFCLQELLQVHASRLQREEAGAAADEGRVRGGDDLRGHPHSSGREVDGQLRTYLVSDADLPSPLQLESHPTMEQKKLVLVDLLNYNHGVCISGGTV